MNLPAISSNAFRLVLGVALLSAGAARLDAQSTWGTSPTSGQMTNDANWLSGTAPADNSAWAFTNSSITTVTNGFAGRTVTGIVFTANATNTSTGSGYTLTGSNVTLTGGITNQSTNSQLITAGLTISSAVTLTNPVNSGTAYITIGGALTGSGTITYGSANSSGRLVLQSSTSSNFTGALLANTGRLNIANIQISGQADYTFNNSGGTYLTTSNTVYNFGSLSGNGFIQANGNNFPNTLVIGAKGSSTIFSGNISSNLNGTNSLIKVGAGTLTLAGTNTYHGTTTISNGVLQIGNNGTIGSFSNTTSITLAGGALAFNRSDNIVQGTSFLTNGSAITGTGSLIQSGSGTLTLNQANNYEGATIINGGTLLLIGSGALSNSATVSVASGATLDLGGRSQQIAGLNGAGIVTNSSGTLTVNKASGSETFSGSIRGAGDFVKTGAGTFVLSGNNSFGGTTTVNQGTLVVNGTNSGLGSVTVAVGAILAGSGTINGQTIINGTLQPTAP